MLSEARYLGDPERLAAIHDFQLPHSRFRIAGAAFSAASATARRLAPLSAPRPASEQLLRLLEFWRVHLRPIADGEAVTRRERRARAAIGDILSALAAVHASYDDPEWTIADLGVAVRRWIEEHTFDSEASGGIQLLDDQAARYGDFDDLAIVGLVETDWPEKPRRNVFYPPSLLKSLGGPSEKDRRAAADARFLDLLTSASCYTTVSTFTLDEDALVSRSMQLDEIPRARLTTVARPAGDDTRVFEEEALSLEPVSLDTVDADARAWAALRMS